MKDIITNLAGVITALNSISVSGKDNCGKLFGSIDLLEKIYAELSAGNDVDGK